MTNKVRIPQNVADAIETLRNAEYSDYGIVKYVDDGGPIHIKFGSELQEVLRDWTYENDGENSDLLLDALRIGYEIESEPLKVGDWAVHERKEDGERFVGIIKRIEEGVNGQKAYANWNGKAWGGFIYLDDLEKCTPEEVEQEKERQVWAKIGREVKEFREGDVGIYRNGLKISDTENFKRYYENGGLLGFYPTESFISFVDGDTHG